MASVPKQKHTSGEKQNNSLWKSNLFFFLIHWHQPGAAWHMVYCKQTLGELRQGAAGSLPVVLPTLSTFTVWRRPPDRGKTRVPATFCATHVAAAVTAKVSSGMTEGSCIEIRLSQTSEPPCCFSKERESCRWIIQWVSPTLNNSRQALFDILNE